MFRAFCLALSPFVAGAVLAAEPVFSTAESLGEALFFDTGLSANRSQSCATCHDPSAGLADPRETAAGKAVSLGDDGRSLGDRTAPAIGYAGFIPGFHRREDGEWVGGLFWDGRAATLEDQAGGPPLNPIEMGMADKAAVLARLQENPDYIAAMDVLYGEGTTSDPERAYERDDPGDFRPLSALKNLRPLTANTTGPCGGNTR